MDPSPPRGSPSREHTTDNDTVDNGQNQPRVRFAEGEPQASYKILQPVPRRASPSVITTDSAGRPAVFWDDRDNELVKEPTNDGFTFYREGTPTPPEYDGHEKALGGGGTSAVPVTENSTVGGGTIGSDRDFNLGAANQGEFGNWSVADSNEMSLATKKKALRNIIIVGVLIFLCLAVGVGVGLGVGLSKARSAGAAPAQQPSSTTMPASASSSSPALTSSTPITTTPAGTESVSQTATTSTDGPRPTYNSDCPNLNNTVYHVPGSTRSFKRICGVDYSGSGAVDLAQVYTGSFADCMNSCASLNSCAACSWGYLQGDEGDKHRCYMKTNLTASHTAAKDWCFAILQ